MRHVNIIGTGSYTPDNTMSNDDIAKLVDTSDEWITSRTGIRERRISTKESTADMAYEAAKRAIKSAGITVDDIELIICATITPDYFMPSVACTVQGMLMAHKSAAFDLNAACTGFVYAMVTASQFIQSGMYNKVLVIGVDTISKILDWQDRSTCVLFGDGAGAAVLSASDIKRGIIASTLSSDGSKQSILYCEAIPLANPYIKYKEEPARPSIKMQGQEVFKFAVRSVTDTIKKVLTMGNLTEEDVKFLVSHQANRRIIDVVAKNSNIPIEKFYMNLERYGNTSSASIGIALDELVKTGDLKSGDIIILVGFGGGMTSGAIAIEW
ncbi:MAG: ketoacyl-ACP synthase III [Clostridiales bacterium]|nr:ketoacyl-ACP synthase III [Clostridiales bacterium]